MAPEPKKKDPRKQLLKPLVASKGFQGVQGVHPVMRGAPPKAAGVISPTAEGKWAAGSAPRGRPVSNIGAYLIKPTADSPTGFEMLNDSPDLLKSVQDRYLKAFQLPPSLQPKYLRKPEVMDKQRSQAISKGFRNPRSQQR